MIQFPAAFWSISASEMLQNLETTKDGLTGKEALRRLASFGANLLKPPKRSDALTLLLFQFKSPIILILFFATGLSFFLHDPVDACIILFIILISGFLGFWQEYGASRRAATPRANGRWPSPVPEAIDSRTSGDGDASWDARSCHAMVRTARDESQVQDSAGRSSGRV